MRDACLTMTNSESSINLRAIFCSLILAAIFLTGCGDQKELAPVAGKVTYNGQPLTFGGIMFQADSGQPSRAVIQADGSFRLTTDSPNDGANVGMNRVKITCYESQDPSLEQESEPTLGKLLIPKKYTHLNSSGIQLNVPAEGKTDFLIELSDDDPDQE